MEPLAGWTVAVTADRRAAEQVAMLERRGASVLLGPVVQTMPLGPEAGLRAATQDLIDCPPDVLVANTGIGIRSWFASAWTWGLGDSLTDTLSAVEVLARGPKAAAAIVGEGLDVHWRAPAETLADVLAYLLVRPIYGTRIAVQLAGRLEPWFTSALRDAGAIVIELAVYESLLAAPSQQLQRLIGSIVGGEVDAITFTAAHAVSNLIALGACDASHVSRRLADGSIVAACVGPVTAAAAREAGAASVIVAEPARLGSLVRALTQHFSGRARRLELSGVSVVIQGGRLEISGNEVRLTRRERSLLEFLLDADGAVLSKANLAGVAWDADVDEHTVEAAVNRLRRKLGPAAVALVTSNRRGYRLVTRCA